MVDFYWTITTFPNNIPWDYAHYVVSNSGAHAGEGSEILDLAAGHMAMDFGEPAVGGFTHALGYSYSEDPKFMYCAEDMTTEGDYNWWLPSCELSGGSSGGPWVQKMDETSGDGPVISVNSWGYAGSPGMAGPKLNGTSAICIFLTASVTSFLPADTAEGKEGIAQICN